MKDKYGNTADIDYIRVNRNGETYENMYRLTVKDRSMTTIHVSIHRTEHEAKAVMESMMIQ